MTTQSRYGFSDLVVDEDVKLPKYAKIVDEEGNEHEIECYHIEEEDEVPYPEVTADDLRKEDA
ncbi:MAG: hypothetical protein CL557_12325 [Alphaproteobacteria bacterium]|nr:hypothetical protein [Alphaproteobacteria bacterium]|tara:strand:- start:2819 stop:3007 length:189 start_codon:yes stop_codon:yes gene_type:complete